MFFSSLSLFAVRSYPEEMDSTPQFDVWFALGFERGIVCEGTIRVSQGTASCRVYHSQGGVRRTGNAESARMFCLLWGTNKMDSFHQRDTELVALKKGPLGISSLSKQSWPLPCQQVVTSHGICYRIRGLNQHHQTPTCLNTLLR